MNRIKTHFPHLIALFGAVIFLDSLRYKFTNHPNTQTIFGKLNDWAATFGAEGLFAPWGLFGQYAVGTIELIAAVLLLVGITATYRRLQFVGAFLAFIVMSGAVSFHLFTPLGIDPNNDGGGLFVAALVLWIGSAILLYVRRSDLKTWIRLKTNFFLNG